VSFLYSQDACVLSTTISPQDLANLHHYNCRFHPSFLPSVAPTRIVGNNREHPSTTTDETPRYDCCEPQHRHAFLPSQYPARRMTDPPASACHYCPGSYLCRPHPYLDSCGTWMHRPRSLEGWIVLSHNLPGGAELTTPPRPDLRDEK
jgi:hypothetical protein